MQYIYTLNNNPIRINNYFGTESKLLKNNCLYCIELDETYNVYDKVFYDSMDGYNFIYTNGSEINVGVPGLIGNCIEYGTISFLSTIETTNNLTFNYNTSQSFWVKIQSFGDGDKNIMTLTGSDDDGNKSSTIYLYVKDTDHKLYLQYHTFESGVLDYTQTLNTNYTLSTCVWYNIVLVNKGYNNVFDIYVNGSKVYTYSGDTSKGSNLIYLDSVIMGGQTSDMYMDQFAFWIMELSGKKIKDLYNNHNGLAFTNW